MSLDPVVGFPQQFRWGTETESNMQIPLPSGFGFRGTKDQPVATYESEFYVGRVAHFNNPITGDMYAAACLLLLVLLLTIDFVGSLIRCADPTDGR
jgi:hypothetical protein